MTTTKITVAGVELTACKNKAGEYGVSAREYQEYLGLDDDFTTDLKRGRRPELLLEAGIHSGVTFFNSRDGRATKTFINTRDLTKLIGTLARRGNNIAFAWLVALANETLERRIDSALNVDKPEEDYEASTRNFFRELARKRFLPNYCEWLKQYEVSPCYGAEVNKLKHALKLPIQSVESYSTEQMETWASGISCYDGLRIAGFGHKRALKQLQLTTEARA